MKTSSMNTIDQTKSDKNLINKSVSMRINRSIGKLSREFCYLDLKFWSQLRENMCDLIGMSNIKLIGIIMSLVIINRVNTNLVENIGQVMTYCYLNPKSTLSKTAEIKMKGLSARLSMRLNYRDEINASSINLLLEQLKQIKSILSLVKTKSKLSNMFMSLIEVIDDII